MNADDILNTLKAIRAALPPPDDRMLFVPIDDLLAALRELRRRGFIIRRQARKSSIWLVLTRDPTFYETVLAELYVDRTRTLPAGTILSVPRPEWRLSNLRYTPEITQIEFRELYYGRWNPPTYPTVD